MSFLEERLAAVRSYWKRYWQGEVPMLHAVKAKSQGVIVKKPSIGITTETDLDALANQLIAWADSHEFYGGAIPFYCVYLFDVYSLTGAMMGAEVVRIGDSCHMKPMVEDLDAAELAVDLHGPTAKRLAQIAGYLKERLAGKVLVSACAIGGNLDVLEAVRGSEQLLMDLYDNPAGVHRCLKQVDAAAAEVLKFFSELYEFDHFGSVCRHKLWCPGKIGVPQCDFGYMLSPGMFREFALPYLHEEFSRLDGVCYHLDGLGNLPNLEAMCAEERVHLIQWVPGAGQEDKDWSWVFAKADALGKGSLRSGSVGEFQSWYQKYQAPWQFWDIVRLDRHVDALRAVLKSFDAAC